MNTRQPHPPPRGPRIGPHGERLCIDCGQPNDPDHPNSPRCPRHRRERRRHSEAASRARKQRAQELLRSVAANHHLLSADHYAGPEGMVLLAGRYAEVRDAYGQLLSALAQARRNLEVNDPNNPRHLTFFRSTLAQLIRDLEDFNEVVRPLVYPSRPRQPLGGL